MASIGVAILVKTHPVSVLSPSDPGIALTPQPLTMLGRRVVQVGNLIDLEAFAIVNSFRRFSG